MRRLLEENKEAVTAVTLSWIVTITRLIYPFSVSKTMMSWDMAGHYFSAWFIQNHLFPDFLGWNPFHLAGMPQGYFYPPLFHWLVAALAQLTGLDAAFKIIVSASLLALPPSAYICCRSLGLGKKKSGIATLLLLLVFSSSAINHMGGDFHSLFSVGLVTASFALPILLAYIASIRRLMEKGAWGLPSILLATIALSHTITFAVALIVLLASLIANHHRVHPIKIAKHLGAAAGLSAAWAVPAIMYSEEAFIHTVRGEVEMSFALLVLAAGAITSLKDRKCWWPTITTAAIIVFMVVGSSIMPFHYYRLGAVLAFLIIVLLMRTAKLLMESAGVRIGWNAFLVASLAVAAASLALAGDVHPYNDWPTPAITELDGRILEASYAGEHYAKHVLPIASGAAMLSGLFVESSRTTPFIYLMQKELDINAFMWGGYIPHMFTAEYARKLPRQMDVMGANYVLTKDAAGVAELFNETEVIAEISAPPQNKTLIKIGDSSLAEVLDYSPERLPRHGTWEDDSYYWFVKDLQRVYTEDDFPKTYEGGGNISLVKEGIGEYVFSVDAQEPAPVFIKISYFPVWEAYCNGEKTRIYRATPNFMLTACAGELRLEFQRGLWSNIGLAATVFTALLLAYARMTRSQLP
ncbi:MAG: hypothetical protein JW834_02245 [Candidatus Diapherotrites archaeon]|nr:hypothetical protein [Candidatus Diapherotrites archaeon]